MNQQILSPRATELKSIFDCTDDNKLLVAVSEDFGVKYSDIDYWDGLLRIVGANFQWFKIFYGGLKKTWWTEIRVYPSQAETETGNTGYYYRAYVADSDPFRAVLKACIIIKRKLGKRMDIHFQSS